MAGEYLIYAYFFVGGALLLLVLLGLLVSLGFPGIDKRSRLFFTASFSLLIISMTSYVIDLCVYTNPDLAWAGRVISFIETLTPSILMPILAVYVLTCCQKKASKSPFLYASIALCALVLMLLIITQFTDSIYYFTEDNQFIRGPLYWILIVLLLALILLNIVEIIREKKVLGRKYFIAFMVYLLPLLITMSIQLFVDVFLLIVIGLTISALSMFGIIMADQAERYLRQQKEIADQRASIAVLQMRPHFIYNTMTSIYYLCEQDPAKAQQVTLDFTTYLRKNFNAITGKEPIPFAEELEHTRAYLAVVSAQFEDNLSVEFDTPYISFRLPPLTLQPLVENAVKYGLDVDASEPLRVVVKTEQSKEGYIITVSDSGPGFSNNDNGEPHIALNNIRERLSSIGATLLIFPGETIGTVVKVFIPDKTSEMEKTNKN